MSVESKQPRSWKVTNYYERCDNEDNAVFHYPNEDIVKIKLPMRAVILGPSGVGKSNVAVDLLPAIGTWKNVIILAKNLDQPLYRFVGKRLAELEKEHKRGVRLMMIDNIAELPDIDLFKPTENTLLIVDDFVADDPKSLLRLNEFWMRGRGKGISPVFISQSYFDTPKMIRKNSDYVFIRKIGNPLDLARILKEYALGSSLSEMTKKYEQATAGDMTNFFLIDRFNQDLSLRFRHNYDPMK